MKKIDIENAAAREDDDVDRKNSIFPSPQPYPSPLSTPFMLSPSFPMPHPAPDARSHPHIICTPVCAVEGGRVAWWRYSEPSQQHALEGT